MIKCNQRRSTDEMRIHRMDAKMQTSGFSSNPFLYRRFVVFIFYLKAKSVWFEIVRNP